MGISLRCSPPLLSLKLLRSSLIQDNLYLRTTSKGWGGLHLGQLDLNFHPAKVGRGNMHQLRSCVLPSGSQYANGVVLITKENLINPEVL